jgi:hypothetical protein
VTPDKNEIERRKQISKELKLNNIDEINEWLEENGGNCEVPANVEEKFDDNGIL